MKATHPFLLTTVLLTLVGCATSVPMREGVGTLLNAQEEEVVAAAETLFAAMEARDTSALRALFLPEGRVASLRTGGARSSSPQITSAAEFIAGFSRRGEVIRERIWDPQVEIDGDLASLWAPYDLYRGDAFSHCGVDTFQFMRVQGEWKILALSYTVQPEGCRTAPGS